MAPIILATLGEFASQLTQEFGDRDSQIVRLEEENARLHALLDAATAASSNTTAATLGVESRFSGVANETRQQSENSLLDEACDVTEVDGGPSPRFPGAPSGRANNHRRMGNSIRRQDWSSDDDEDPIPVPKKEKAPVTAAAKNAATRTSILDPAAETNKRKRAAEPSSSSSSRLSESLNGLVVNESNTRSQQNEARPAKRTRPEHNTTAFAARPRRPPVKPVETPVKKRTQPPHPYTPLRESPYENLIHPEPPSPPPPMPAPTPTPNQFPATFRLPAGSISNDGATNQATAEANETTSAYAETFPFIFKFVSNYVNHTGSSHTNLKAADFASVQNVPAPFLTLLATLNEEWEERAGAYWAWEFQKRRSGGGDGMPRRYCVTSKLAKRWTRWRREDNGFWACVDCTEAARPCFTWATDKDGGYGNGEDAGEVFGAPKGEFWCLPVHKEDRKCEIVEGEDIRTWVNGGESFGNGDHGADQDGEKSVRWAEGEYDDDGGFESEEPSGRKRRRGGVKSLAPSPQTTATATSRRRRGSAATLIVVLKLSGNKRGR
jgi:hypothetical protein